MKRLLLLALTFTSSLIPQTITVNWNSSQQTIDGFGGSSAGWYGITNLSTHLKETFFTTTGSNLGFSILRIEGYGSLAFCRSDIGTTGACVGSSPPYFDSKAIDIAQYAVAQGAKIIVTFWVPPTNMICAGGGSCTGSNPYTGTFIGNAGNYAAYAAIQAATPGFFASYGVPIYAISIQNEPDYTLTNTVQWTAAQLHSYIPYLSSALFSAGYSSVKIMMPEESCASGSNDAPNSFCLGLSSTTMGDATTAAEVGILAAHGYGIPPNGSGSVARPSFSDFTTQHVWETEDASFDSYSGTMANGLTWAQVLHNYLSTAKVSAFLYWWITCYCDSPYNCGTDNQSLTDNSGNNNNEPLAKRAYVIGHWSKFVRPGWHEVGVTNSGPLLVTAFQDPTKTQCAIVVVNNSRSVFTSQAFAVNGCGPNWIPWITDSTRSLVRQSLVASNSGTLAYTIPASSVVTFATVSAPTVTKSRPLPPNAQNISYDTRTGLRRSSALLR